MTATPTFPSQTSPVQSIMWENWTIFSKRLQGGDTWEPLVLHERVQSIVECLKHFTLATMDLVDERQSCGCAAAGALYERGDRGRVKGSMRVEMRRYEMGMKRKMWIYKRDRLQRAMKRLSRTRTVINRDGSRCHEYEKRGLDGVEGGKGIHGFPGTEFVQIQMRQLQLMVNEWERLDREMREQELSNLSREDTMRMKNSSSDICSMSDTIVEEAVVEWDSAGDDNALDTPDEDSQDGSPNHSRTQSAASFSSFRPKRVSATARGAGELAPLGNGADVLEDHMEQLGRLHDVSEFACIWKTDAVHTECYEPEYIDDQAPAETFASSQRQSKLSKAVARRNRARVRKHEAEILGVIDTSPIKEIIIKGASDKADRFVEIEERIPIRGIRGGYISRQGSDAEDDIQDDDDQEDNSNDEEDETDDEDEPEAPKQPETITTTLISPPPTREAPAPPSKYVQKQQAEAAAKAQEAYLDRELELALLAHKAKKQREIEELGPVVSSGNLFSTYVPQSGAEGNINKRKRGEDVNMGGIYGAEEGGDEVRLHDDIDDYERELEKVEERNRKRMFLRAEDNDDAGIEAGGGGEGGEGGEGGGG